MKRTEWSRRGVSLVELIIAIGISAAMIGFLLVAVQRVRKSATLVENKNNQRQIILGVHQLAANNEGRIDNLTRSAQPNVATLSTASLFYRLIPIVHGHLVAPTGIADSNAIFDFASPNVPVYRNKSDFSWDYDPAEANVRGKCSYALNMFAMDGSVNLTSSIPDGTSSTIAFAEKYAVRGNPTSTLGQTVNLYTGIFNPLQGEIYGHRRATFADRGWEDVVPVTDPTSSTTRSSVPGKTFQVRPRPEDVDASIPQTPHEAGLTVAMFDGSVRTISPSVPNSIFWALVTPAGNEVIGSNY